MKDRGRRPDSREDDLKALEDSLRARYHHPQADSRFVANLERRLVDKGRRSRTSGLRRLLNRWSPVLLWAPLAALAAVLLYGFLYLFGPALFSRSTGQPVAMAPSVEPTFPLGAIEGLETVLPETSPLPYEAENLPAPEVLEGPEGTPVQVFAPTVTPQPFPTEQPTQFAQVTSPVESPAAEIASVPDSTSQVMATDLALTTPGVGGGTGPNILEYAQGTQPAVTQLAFEDLLLELYPLNADPQDNPSIIERDGFPSAPGVQIRRAPWRDVPTRDIQTVNQTINRFGFDLRGDVLYRGDAPLLTGVRLPNSMPFPGAVLTNEGKDFSLALERGIAETLLVTRDRVLKAEPSEDGTRLFVYENRQVIFTTSLNPSAAGIVRGFWNWDGDWVLELINETNDSPAGSVFINGESIVERLQADEVFGWWLLDGEPLYFFRRDSRVFLSYAGKVSETSFDQVLHYNCCSLAALDIHGNAAMVWFFAQQDGSWYYAEAGVYK